MKEFTTLNSKKNRRDKIEVALSCAILLFLWEIIAIKLNNDIFLPTLGQVFKAIEEAILSQRFFQDIGATVVRSLFSYIVTLIVAILLGIASYLNNFLKNFFKPILTLVQSVPALVFMLIVLIWFNKNTAPYVVVFMMVFPILYDGILGAINSIDKSILEMADLYKVGYMDKIKKIYFPAIKFKLAAILFSTFSLGLKVAIAGEVYGQPTYGIGSIIQMEKTNFNTPAVFAWILIIVFISFVLGLCQKGLMRRTFKWKR